MGSFWSSLGKTLGRAAAGYNDPGYVGKILAEQKRLADLHQYNIAEATHRAKLDEETKKNFATWLENFRRTQDELNRQEERNRFREFATTLGLPDADKMYAGFSISPYAKEYTNYLNQIADIRYGLPEKEAETRLSTLEFTRKKNAAEEGVLPAETAARKASALYTAEQAKENTKILPERTKLERKRIKADLKVLPSKTDAEIAKNVSTILSSIYGDTVGDAELENLKRQVTAKVLQMKRDILDGKLKPEELSTEARILLGLTAPEYPESRQRRTTVETEKEPSLAELLERYRQSLKAE